MISMNLVWPKVRSAIITLNLGIMDRYKNLSLAGYLHEIRLNLKKMINDLKDTTGYMESLSIYENDDEERGVS